MFIKLKDGTQKEFPRGATVAEIAKALSEGLLRVAVCGKVNGKLVDLSCAVNEDSEVQIITFSDEEGKAVYRHTAAHILAQAVKTIYPTCNLAIGPSVDNGFYYDFDFKTPIGRDDLEKIEKQMDKIIRADHKIERRVVDKAEARRIFTEIDELYKLQMLDEMPDGEEISVYSQGQFTELCRGPHLPSTGKIKAFRLTSITGAYWKGNEKNKMLTRIYGTAFDKKADLEAYLAAVEEAKKRDHNKLGRELGFFMTDENVGQGLPLLMPKGAKVLQILQRFIEDLEEKRGYVLTKTPAMSKNNLFKISGHWSHYRDGMFVIGDDDDDEILALRPMTCPFQFMIYKNGLKSYRDLPMRYGETATLYRNENSGEMHGLIRLRQFTLSDGHIICTPSQLKKEFADAFKLVSYVMTCLGLEGDISYRFSKWDPKNTAKYIDNPAAWERTQNIMRKILNALKINYVEADGEAAFYGPKLDVQIKNVHGKEDTIFTIQVDFALADRFEMEYVAEDGSRKRPYIIHRSSLGCYERTLALLIEKYAGALPLWMSATQVKVLSLTDRTARLANSIAAKLNSKGIRAESDNRNEKIGYKIREATEDKIPYMLIVGDKEKENKVVAVRGRTAGDLGVMPLAQFIKRVEQEVKEFK